VQAANLDECNDKPPSGVVQLRVAPAGVVSVQPVAASIVLPHKQIVQRLQSIVLV